jgi:membrane protein
MKRVLSAVRMTRNLLVRAAGDYVSHGASKNAAAISYYVLFSIFPLMIFIIGAAGLIFGSESQVRQDIVDEVVEEVPLTETEGRDQVRDAVQEIEGAPSGVIGLVALVAMMWGASGMFGAIRYSLNAAFDDVDVQRPFVPQKLIDLALVLGLAAAFVASVVASGVLQYASSTSKSLAGLGDLADELGRLWGVVSFVIPVVIAFAAFMALYTLVSSRIRSPVDVWPGALLAAVMFQVLNIGFGIYLEHFAGDNLVFGAIGGVAVFLVWVYVGANIMIFGAEVAAEYPRLRAEPAEQTEMLGLSKPLPRRAWGMVRSLFVRDGKPAGEEIGEKEPRVRL